MDVTDQRGQHALIYGERGVGKTSLSRVVMQHCLASNEIAVYYTCSSEDTFTEIWHRTMNELTFTVKTPGLGFNAPEQAQIVTLADMLPTPASPDDVRRVLAQIGQHSEVTIFVDEFDRPTDRATRTQFADLVKILADQGVNATLVLVGVASSVSDLIGEHESIGRSLVQISMPTMSRVECSEIIRSGIKAAEMTIDDGFVKRVVDIAQGFPHYVHLMAQHGARDAIEHARTHVAAQDSFTAVRLALEDVSQSVREAYHRATFSTRETIYEHVLIACALAQKDDLGEFGSADLREPLYRVTGRNYDIPAYSAHLNAFSSTGSRGGILRKVGEGRFRYRFMDPLMTPYVLMRGHAAGLV